MVLDTTKEGQQYFSAVWVWDNSAGAYIDNTKEARSPGGTAFSVLEDVNDWLYLGSESKFDLAALILGTNGSLGALTYQYVTTSGNPNTWTEFVPEAHFFSDSVAYDFSNHGAITVGNLRGWASDAFSSAQPHGAAPPDTNERFWVRISAASVSTVPKVERMLMRAKASYCTPTDVANIMQIADFSSSTTPTRNSIEDYIAAAQSYIDYTTRKSWRVNYVEEDHEAFQTSGTRLKRKDAFKVTKAEVWNGSNFEARSEGRNNDFFLLPDQNMLMWARYFLLPARFFGANASVNWWGFGEFIKPVRISYLYGRNQDMDEREGFLVYDMARKLAAIDVWNNHDYTVLAPSGVDNVSMSDKIRNWKEEIDMKLESVSAWQVF